MTHPCYRHPLWPKVRRAILQRDDYRCQIRRARCRGAANQVDHIDRLADGGAWFDPANLRAACLPCNVAESNDARLRIRTAPPSRPWL